MFLEAKRFRLVERAYGELFVDISIHCKQFVHKPIVENSMHKRL